MLPRPLCESLCSLNPGTDRLTYSVEWTVTPEGVILSEWFGRTVIRSCVKMAYEHAQMMIDDPDRTEWEAGILPGIEEPYSPAVISEKVNILQRLALKFREKREEKGFLKIDQPKLCFILNPESGLPDGFKLHEHRHSNRLIEEFMLLANMAVARKIYATFPQLSVLRKHSPPKSTVLQQSIATMRTLGVDIASGTAAEMGQTLVRLKQSPLKSAVVNCLLSKSMELAQYFCSSGKVLESDFHHYGLNVPCYTHFTSPIRRYPDILVHRLLDHAVRGTTPQWIGEMVQRLCNHCNDKRLAAKRVSESSAVLFLGLFIQQSGSINQVGAVMNVLDHAVDVIIVELGIVRRVYMDRLDIKSFKTRRINGINYLDLVWNGGKKQTLTTFSRVELTLKPGDKSFDFLTIIDMPGREAEEEVVTID